MPLPIRTRIVGLTLLAAVAFGCHDPTLRTPVPRTYFLVEKGPYQSLYGADRRIERLLYDRDGDRIADAVILYSPDGTVRQAEIDTDLDRMVDRWEYFEGGALVRLGFDDNGDGTPDRVTSAR
jgi:hypothetical protein